jgi:hypothetical protein
VPESGKDLSEVVSDVAARKKRVAEVRFAGAPTSGESPRDVYAAGCRAIADALAADGFTYAQSSQTLTRKSGDLVFRISFSSSHHNIAGELVALEIYAVVASPKMKRWGKSHPNLTMKRWDRIAGGQIGNLAPRHSWMEWNLASPGDRERQIADVVATIRRIASPYFTLFEDVPGLATRLASEDIPSLSPASALDFLMCFGTRSDALRAARGMLRRLAEAQKSYPAALARLRKKRIPSDDALKDDGEELAAATVLFDFPDLSGGTD